MCITFFYIANPNQISSPYKYIQAFNREECFDRGTTQLGSWEEDPNILAGQDLKAKGTWLGLNTKTGNIAFLTNLPVRYIEGPLTMDPASRGALVSNFLKSDFYNGIEEEKDNKEFFEAMKLKMIQYMDSVQQKRMEFRGFNLVIGNLRIMEFRHLGNEISNQGAVELKDGPFVMTNCPFSQQSARGEKGFKPFMSVINEVKEKQIDNNDEVISQLESAMKINRKFPVSVFNEVAVVPGKSIQVIKSSVWATKTTTMIVVDKNNRLKIMEVSYDEDLNKRASVVKDIQL